LEGFNVLDNGISIGLLKFISLDCIIL
jgi:hypothetical protein